MNKPAFIALLACLTFSAVGCDMERPGFMDVQTNGDGGTNSIDSGFNRTDTGTSRRETGGPILIGDDAACAQQTSGTTRTPPNILIVLDRSGSMDTDGKWDNAVSAITSLLGNLSDDTRVGLTVFPSLNNPSSESGYTTPLVPIGALSTTRAQITNALANNGPTGGTPMACAYVGSKTYLDRYMNDGTLNTILITDGEPTDECSGQNCGLFDINCQLNASRISQLRIQATITQLGNASVKTFVAGTADANNQFLSALAINGRTKRSPGCETSNTCHYTLGTGTFEQDLAAALADITGRAATCEYRISVDPTQVDLRLINVLYTPAPGDPQELVPRDTSHTNGWDFSGDMRTIFLHGGACDSVLNNLTGGTVKILYGCPTVGPG